MAHIIADRVQETSATTGTGTLTLAGAVTGFQAFSAVMANGDTIYYTITDQTASANWEVGVGTWGTGGTLARTTILASSTGSAVNFTSGALYVFGTYPASRAVYVDNSGVVTSSGTVPLSEGGTGKTTAPAANAELTGFTTTATAGGTTTLTNASSYYQVFTGTSAQTIQLPATSTLAQGWSYHLVNNSTGTLTLNTSTAVTLGTIPPGITVMATAQTTSGNTATDWEFGYTDFSTITGTGSAMLNKSPVLAAGTSGTGGAPLKFTTGTNLATPEAGAVEYDGSLKYFTPVGTARALTLNTYYYRKNTTTNITTGTGTQAWLGLTNGVTLQANTIYEVEGEFGFTPGGTTSHNESIGFVLTTATLSVVGISILRNQSSTTAANGFGLYYTATASGATAVANGVASTTKAIFRMKGVLGVSTGGQVNPVIQLSASPGGASTVDAGAWIRFTPIGTTGSNVSIGTWA